MIVFRVSATDNSGLGHLARCVLLAKSLTSKGMRVAVFLDILHSKHLPFVESLEVKGLYDEIVESIDESVDAEQFITECLNFEKDVEWVIVDHYFLGKTWEKLVKNGLKTKVCAIDDLLREHDSDALIDYRWRAQHTQTAYNQQVSVHCTKLLGSDYVILDQRLFNTSLSQKNSRNAHDKVYNLLISLGGGGSGYFISNLLTALIDKIRNSRHAVSIYVVIGPFLTESAQLLASIEQINLSLDSKIQLIPLVGVSDLIPYLVDTDFYIGAIGTTMYQLRVLRTPAITFSIADNQQNDLLELADIGHYWHLNQLVEQELPQLADFVVTCLSQYERVSQLFSQTKVTIDGKGIEKIIDFLCFEQIELPKLVSHNDHNSASKLIIQPVSDQDIVHYLMSRNLSANRQNMVRSDLIKPLDHFKWWLTKKRASFKLMNYDKQPILYIWHELKHIHSKCFLIGGWFVCQEDIKITDVMFALEWQLKICKQEYPLAIWIAVIHRNNRVVKRLNDYFGFKQIDKNYEHYSVVKILFPLADESDFYYMYK